MNPAHYDYEAFKNFLRIRNTLKEPTQILEFLKKNSQKFGMLEYLYFLSSLNGDFQQYVLNTNSINELRSDSIQSEEYTKAFMLYHDYFLYEQHLNFRIFDVFNNLIELNNFEGIGKLFLKSLNSRIDYSKNKELLLYSGFPFNEKLIYCDPEDREEFLYIQKLQFYFKSDSKLLIERVKGDKALKDFFEKYSVVDRDFGIEFLNAYFGNNAKKPNSCNIAKKS